MQQVTELKDTSSKGSGSIAALLRRGTPLAAVLLVVFLMFAMWGYESPKRKCVFQRSWTPVSG
jgi:hypothetical protein